MTKRITPDNTALFVIDLQGKLAQIQHDRDALFTNVKRMINGAKHLKIPIIWMEQNPEGLGPTVPEIAETLTPLTPMPKTTFSGCGNDAIMKYFLSLKRQHALLTGIEAHVCVYQTAMDLLRASFQVSVVTDAVSSRTAANQQLGLDRMRAEGVTLTGTEMALYELLRDAGDPRFKEMLKIVK